MVICVEEVYVSQPDGFVDPDNPNYVYKLKKALYELKQAPRAWYDMLSSFMIYQDLYKCSVDPTLFILRKARNYFWITDLSNPESNFINHKTKMGLLIIKGNTVLILVTQWILPCGEVQTDEDKEVESHCTITLTWSKHIDIRFHFIKEHVENGVIELYFVNTEYQLADIFTKALARERIEFLINKLGMRSFTPETLKQLADEVDE
ncbi:retrovirus-related pol polyprotein from transposon TNT 1-94 [Tanacetum coccineum]